MLTAMECSGQHVFILGSNILVACGFFFPNFLKECVSYSVLKIWLLSGFIHGSEFSGYNITLNLLLFCGWQGKM